MSNLDRLNRILQDSRPDNPAGNRKKYMRAKDCIERYSLGRTKLVELAREAGAVIKIDCTLLIDVERFDKFLETFREPGRSFKK